MRYNRVMPPAEHITILTVSQLTRRVKTLLEAQVGVVWVSGEISNWHMSPAGHAYFTLKDADSQVSAVIFKGILSRIQFKPGDGLEVVLSGECTVYEKRGAYQIVCRAMHPKGLGALQIAFEQLKKKLDAEGLFDPRHKKPLPMLPRRIGIVTSPTGAALRDILNVLGRRFAGLHIILHPARVQGEGAAAEIAQGITALDAFGVDVMIVGRGGGSIEDLWPFNEEQVVRAIHAARTPVISAVGHEIDFTLSDFAADLRAPTPSAAAELVVQEQAALVARIADTTRAMQRAMRRTLERTRQRYDTARGSYVFQRPADVTRARRQEADELRIRLDRALAESMRARQERVVRARRAMVLLSPDRQLARAGDRLCDLRARLAHSGKALPARAAERLAHASLRLESAGPRHLERLRARCAPAIARLDAMSPLKILSRGYALVRKLPAMTLVRDAQQLHPQDTVHLTLGRGHATATIDSIEDTKNG